MSNAAIFLHPDGYDTTGPRLMGRHSAGESFLRGFLRHADVESHVFYSPSGHSVSQLAALVERIHPTTKPVTWIAKHERPRLAEVGCLYYPQPSLAREAWNRRPYGPESYSICGVTHTTASHLAMDSIAELMTGPTEPWDGLVCTSAAVRKGVETQLEAVRHDLVTRLGATRLTLPQLATIPLGVNVDDFARTPANRMAWRRKLDIPDDAIVALYMGRFSAAAKMNPAMMAMALEAAALATGQQIYWVVAGWGGSDDLTAKFHAQVQTFCPQVHYRAVDGRPADTRFSIWSVADLFISFSDNVQETFGLTPIEAMAAGLPSVVTDWDGYRDTVRHGLDGFRIATMASRFGRDLAYHFSNGWVSYDNYLAAAAQMTTIDQTAAITALCDLITQPELRTRMGVEAQAQARRVFDWAMIIPQYQALWAELAAIRRAAPRSDNSIRMVDDPRRMDPLHLFASYPTRAMAPDIAATLVPGVTWEVARQRLASPMGAQGAWALPTLAEVQQLYDHVAAHPASSLADLQAIFPAHRRHFAERGMLWLAKFAVLSLSDMGTVT